MGWACARGAWGFWGVYDDDDDDDDRDRRESGGREEEEEEKGGARVSGWVGVALVHIAFGVGLRAYVLGALFR